VINSSVKDNVRDILTRYKVILKELGLSGKDMSVILGMSYGSYKVATMGSAKVVPRWVLSFLECFDVSKKNSATAARCCGVDESREGARLFVERDGEFVEIVCGYVGKK